MQNKRYYLVLLLILILALVVRLYNLTGYGLGGDELYTVACSTGLKTGELSREIFTPQDYQDYNTLPHVVQATIEDNGNNLVYNVIMHYWIKIFGISDFSWRFPSVLFGVLLVALVFRLLQKLYPQQPAIALVGGFLTAIHPVVVASNQNARSYAFATVIVLVASYCFYIIVFGQPKRRHYILYGVLAWVAVMSHYLTGAYFVTHALLFVLLVRDLKKYPPFILAGVCAAIGFGVWMMNGGMEGLKIMGIQSQGWARYIPTKKFADILLPTPTNMIIFWIQNLIRIFVNEIQWLGVPIRYSVIFLLFNFTAIAYAFFTSDLREKKVLFFLLVLTFVPLMNSTLSALMAGHTVGFRVHYMVFAVPFAMMLLARAYIHLFASRPVYKYAFLGIVTVQIGFSFYSLSRVYADNTLLIYSTQRPPNPYKIAAEQIKAAYQPQDTIVYPHPFYAQQVNVHLWETPQILQKVVPSSDRKVLLLRDRQPPRPVADLIDLP